MSLPLIGLSTLTACSKKTSDHPDQTPNQTTVTIGYVGALTGALAHYGKDEENGVRLAINDINAEHPTIAGKPVTFKLQSEDDGADPRNATSAAQRLVDAGVAAVIGHTTSSSTLPASGLYNAAGIPLFSPAVTNPGLTQQGFQLVFRPIASDVQQGKTLAEIAVTRLHAQRIAIFDDRSTYGVGMADEFEKSVKALHGQIVARESGSDKETDFNAPLTRIKSQTPDLIFFAGNDGQAAAIVQQIRNLGMSAQFLAGDGVHTPEFIKLAGKYAEGSISTLVGLPLDKMPGGPDFQKHFQQQFGSIQLFSPYYYDATRIVARAMQAADSTDPKVYGPKIKSIDYQGVTNRIQFDAHGDLVHGQITAYQAQGQKWVELP